ncbi:MAG TPA: hypothetical protein DCF49_02525, partial [Lachnospiraceae bacterium]|nr:hypothetical protein [Lachnospiraceae bacterium]
MIFFASNQKKADIIYFDSKETNGMEDNAMKRMKKLLAVILTASMLLGNTGPAYAAETMGGSTEEIAAEEQRSDSGSGQEAASTQEYVPEDTAGDGGTEDAKEAEAIP